MTDQRNEIIRRVSRPSGGVIEIYRGRTECRYEARTLDEHGEILRDTAMTACQGINYDDPAIALEDAQAHDEALRVGLAEYALDQLGGLACRLEGSPEGNRIADIVRAPMDELDGVPSWPRGEHLPLTFICGVQTWQYKGNLWGGVNVIEADKHGYIAAVLETDMTWLEGWRGDTWAEAFAAIGAALDVTDEEILERSLAETRQQIEALKARLASGDQEARHDLRHLEDDEAAILVQIERRRNEGTQS